MTAGRKLLLAFSAIFAIGTAIAIAQAPPGPASQTVWNIPVDSIKRSYSQGINALSGQSVATDIFQICGGSGVVTRVTKVTVAGKATAVAAADIFLLRRSTAATGGTQQNLTGVVGTPRDGNTAAGVSTFTAYSAAPTTGTLVGIVDVTQIMLNNLTTGIGTGPAIFDFGVRPAMAPVLRGAASCLVVNLTSQVFAGALWTIAAEITEE